MRRPESERQEPLYVKRKYFEMIRDGTKPLELRIGFDSYKAINVGDSITFSSGRGETVDVEITDIRPYTNLEDVIRLEDTNLLAPGIPQGRLLSEAQRIFGESDIAQSGLLLFEFKKIG